MRADDTTIGAAVSTLHLMYAPSAGSLLTADNGIVGIYTNVDVVEFFRIDTPHPADLSGDGVLNFRDVTILTAEWLNTGTWP